MFLGALWRFFFSNNMTPEFRQVSKGRLESSVSTAVSETFSGHVWCFRRSTAVASVRYGISYASIRSILQGTNISHPKGSLGSMMFLKSHLVGYVISFVVIFGSEGNPSRGTVPSLEIKNERTHGKVRSYSFGQKLYFFATPPKINIEPENGGLEDVSHFPGVHFQVPCLFWGVYMDVSENSGCCYPPNHPFVHRVFHYKSSSILGVFPLFLETPIF